MNGRIYDARIARFLQADPFIQAATNTQSFNRYSYVLNNPLNATDPSGFFFKKLWKSIKPFVGAIVGVALVALTGGAASWFVASWYGAATAGAIAGAAGAAANGGNIFRGALTGAISAAAFYGVGSAFQGAEGSGNFLGSGMSAGDLAAKVFAHGMVGGVMSVLQGGKFGHGFASAGVTQAFAGGIDRIGGSKFSSTYFDAGNRALRIAAAAIVGGTSSAMSGGKFANGAMTGAFSRAFNDEAEEHRLKPVKSKITIEEMRKSYVQAGKMIDPNGNGRNECVELVQELTGVGATATWRRGDFIRDNLTIEPGTAIAIFSDEGTYGSSVGRHAAIYVGQNEKGIQVIDQWNGQAPIERTLRFENAKGVNNGNIYYSIMSQ
jgi:hypothetical protein